MARKNVSKCPYNKDVSLKRYGFFKELKIYLSSFFSDNCYPYPVVYTDGLVSYLLKDSKGRNPYGIEIYDEIILLYEPNKMMTVSKAEDYCKTKYFAGLRGGCPSIETLWYICRHFNRINLLICQLGGTPLKKSAYLSDKTVFVDDKGITFEGNPNAKLGYLALNMADRNCSPIVPVSCEKKLVHVRPALKL